MPHLTQSHSLRAPSGLKTGRVISEWRVLQYRAMDTARPHVGLRGPRGEAPPASRSSEMALHLLPAPLHSINPLSPPPHGDASSQADAVAVHGPIPRRLEHPPCVPHLVERFLQKAKHLHTHRPMQSHTDPGNHTKGFTMHIQEALSLLNPSGLPSLPGLANTAPPSPSPSFPRAAPGAYKSVLSRTFPPPTYPWKSTTSGSTSPSMRHSSSTLLKIVRC